MPKRQRATNKSTFAAEGTMTDKQGERQDLSENTRQGKRRRAPRTSAVKAKKQLEALSTRDGKDDDDDDDGDDDVIEVGNAKGNEIEAIDIGDSGSEYENVDEVNTDSFHHDHVQAAKPTTAAKPAATSYIGHTHPLPRKPVGPKPSMPTGIRRQQPKGRVTGKRPRYIVPARNNGTAATTDPSPDMSASQPSNDQVRQDQGQQSNAADASPAREDTAPPPPQAPRTRAGMQVRAQANTLLNKFAGDFHHMHTSIDNLAIYLIQVEDAKEQLMAENERLTERNKYLEDLRERLTTENSMLKRKLAFGRFS